MARLVWDKGVEEVRRRREAATWTGRNGKYPQALLARINQSDSGSNSIVVTIKEGYKRTNEYTTSRLKEKKNTQTQKRNLEEQKHSRGENKTSPLHIMDK
jgi:hypothetical protein